MRRIATGLVVFFVALPSAWGGMPGKGSEELPIPIPERPFLLIDAPHRFTPSQTAWVRLQLRGGGRVRLHVYRVQNPAQIVNDVGRWSQGVSVARSALGREAERLSLGKSPRGALLTLVRRRSVRVDNVRRPRRVANESEVYDSYENEESVATYWVRRERWGSARGRLGRLPAGLYLVRAVRGSWAAATYLSVGRLVLLARRGDSHDTVLVTDEDGAPQAGVAVEVRVKARSMGRAVTGTDGTARLPAADAPALRFIAHRGHDVAWTDVAHARLSACDPRVYLATGRPVYRSGETIYLRGHLRGCAGKGFAPLPDEPVRLRPALHPDKRGDGGVTVRTDADGNFIAELVAHGELHAEVRGRTHHRDVQIDHRSLPRRRLNVTLDRSWAESGRVVGVTVADDDGGWPERREVVLATPAGEQRGRIGPGMPARFRFRVPFGLSALETARVSATITAPGRVTTAAAELWVGARREVLHLHADRTRSRPGGSVPVRLTAASLGGDPVSGTAALALRRSDGNRPVGPVLWQRRLQLGPRGATSLVPTKGSGPWWIEARRGDATSSLVVWERDRPPSLSAGGPLAVRPQTLLASAGSRLPVDLRLPRGGGRAWVTLEQGSVWSSAMVHGAGLTRALLAVPSTARGMASVVVSHIAQGRVRTVTATVEVETSRQVDLSVTTSRRVFAEGARARVTVQARGLQGQPRDGVVSLWLADAGYWELGEDRYPLPGPFFRLPGRMASAGESSRPVVYGAEEGRHVDAAMAWNGKPVAGTTFRHGWGHGGSLVTVKAAGSLPAVADRLARAAGLAGAWVCPSAARAAGRVALQARHLPWDLVATKIAEETETLALVRNRVLRLECGGLGGLGGLGRGGGGGAACMAGRAGLRGITVREETLEGTLRFIGLRRLGPDGRLDETLQLPRHPGRWRIEALVISDDGGGDRAHAIAHTVRRLTVSVDLPPALRPGDEVRGAVRVHGPALAGRAVALRADLPRALDLLTPLPPAVTLDIHGRASVPLRVRVRGGKSGAFVVSARSGRAVDAVRRRLDVLPAASARPVALQALAGPDATEIRLDVPALARRSKLQVYVDTDLRVAAHEVLEQLQRPRWDLPALTIDRLASLRSLDEALVTLERKGRVRWPVGASPMGEAFARHVRGQLDTLRLRDEIKQEIASVVARLEDRQSADGAIAWWSTMRSSTRLTAELLLLLGSHAKAKTWRSAREVIRSRARKGRVSGREVGPVVALLAAGNRSDQKLAAGLLRDRRHHGALNTLEGATWALQAAHWLNDATLRARFGAAVARLVGAGIGDRPVGGCAGPAWWICLARSGNAGAVARGAVALLDTGQPGARAQAARAAAWLARRPAGPWWSWGSADADVLALLAHLAPGRGATRRATRFVVLHRGRKRGQGDIAAAVAVEVARAGPLIVKLPAAAGRAVRVRIEGTLTVQPPPTNVGPARLQRRFTSVHGGQILEVSFNLPRDARGLEVGVPLPSGLMLAGDPSRAAKTTSQHAWHSLMDVGDPRSTVRPRVFVEHGQLRLRWQRLRAGAHRVRVQLVQTTSGTSHAGSAWLRAATRDLWALTPLARVALMP